MKQKNYMEEYHLHRGGSNDIKDLHENKASWLMMAVGLIVLGLIALGLAGCKTQGGVVTTPPSVHQENNIQHKLERQYKLDSIYIDRWHTIEKKGDTVFMYDSIYFSIVELKHDTIMKTDTIMSTDTIHPAPMLVEKQLSDDQVFFIRSGKVAWAVLLLVIIGVVLGIVIKVAK